MLTLSYGFLKPQSPDKGSVFFPALESNIQQLNDHTHDGVTSAKIPSSSVIGVSASILAASWVAVAGQPGTYRQAVTLPGSVTYDLSCRSFRDAVSGHEINLTVEKISSTQYYVYVNDNTLALTVVYSS